jgi:limonene-1,2-epoxide hydrolase
MKHIDVIKSYWTAEGRLDIEGVLAHFTEDAYFESPTMKLRGTAEIRRFYEGMVGGYDGIEVRVIGFIEEGAVLSVEYWCDLERKDGTRRGARGCNVFEVRDNRIANLRCYFNPADF